MNTNTPRCSCEAVEPTSPAPVSPGESVTSPQWVRQEAHFRGLVVQSFCEVSSAIVFWCAQGQPEPAGLLLFVNSEPCSASPGVERDRLNLLLRSSTLWTPLSSSELLRTPKGFGLRALYLSALTTLEIKPENFFNVLICSKVTIINSLHAIKNNIFI